MRTRPLASSCRRNFLDYDAFYRSIGIRERIFADDFPLPFDVGRFEATNSDALFLDAALNAQDREIATLAASGLTNKQIARRVNLSHRTVGAHLYRIFPILGITSRAALHDSLKAMGGEE